MNMGVDQSRHRDLARKVILFYPFIIAETDDLPAIEGNIPLLQFAREDVDERRIFQYGFRLSIADGGVDAFFEHGKIPFCCYLFHYITSRQKSKAVRAKSSLSLTKFCIQQKTGNRIPALK